MNKTFIAGIQLSIQGTKHECQITHFPFMFNVIVLDIKMMDSSEGNLVLIANYIELNRMEA